MITIDFIIYWLLLGFISSVLCFILNIIIDFQHFKKYGYYPNLKKYHIEVTIKHIGFALLGSMLGLLTTMFIIIVSLDVIIFPCISQVYWYIKSKDILNTPFIRIGKR